MADPKWVNDMAHKIDILSVREQIQEDIRSYASSIDDEGIFMTDEVLDELCDIVVSNFAPLIKTFS
jgi:hypothetical protein